MSSSNVPKILLLQISWNMNQTAFIEKRCEMLNREECDNALTRLLRPYFAKVDVQSVYHSINKGHSIEDDSNLLTLLIMEYFDNPPLKFEELKEGMFVWDNKRKVKLLIAYCYSEDDMGYYNLSNPEDYKYIHIEFEENRFYRKEVQE